ncbi:MAG: DUF2075 domain-containing protein [Elusimicrobiota bacterium]
MIIYTATKTEFSNDVLNNTLTDKVVNSLKLKHVSGYSPAEIRAYQNSLRYMETVLSDPDIPTDCGVAIEYVIPSSSRRIDFIISGQDTKNAPHLIIIELKQWESAKLTQQDAVVKTFVNGGMHECQHPSYQAWSYAALLEDYNEAVLDYSISLKPCSYLHNYIPDDVITNSFYQEHLSKAPVFLKNDAIKLREFIKQFVKYGDKSECIFLIESGRIKPSKNLADSLASLMKGNKEFVLIDEQKLVYETVLEMIRNGKKQVLIVNGGAGTGKSVVAVNLLVASTQKQYNARYVTKNSAPRTVYEVKLTGTMKKTRIANLFCGSGKFVDCATNVFDCLIVDEAHRLNERSGMFQNSGENQVKELINAARTCVFFLDEDQKVTLKDIGDTDEIVCWAKKLGAVVIKMDLPSQFRCNGSDGYLAWLDNTLQKRPTANMYLSRQEYDFRVMKSPVELRDMIFEKNQINNKARIVAGYCWNWVSAKDPDAYDIVIPGWDFKIKWNFKSYGNKWIIDPQSVTEAGCIHTCQGLELDYIGVIVGPDLLCRDGEIVTVPSNRARTDKSLNGYRKMLEDNLEKAKEVAGNIIKNTYKTLMTRGTKGCYVYFTDKETEEYFMSRIGK